MNSKNQKYLFSESPVNKAVLAMIIPTVISQLITVVYNMVDTYYIGKLNDPLQVAAIALSLPVFIFLTGFTHLFGVGSASVISKDLGKNEIEHAKQVSVFAVYGSIAITLVYSGIILLFQKTLLPFVGVNQESFPFVSKYLLWVVVIGGVPTVLSGVMSQLIRSEGKSKEAGFGLMLGGFINIILDPVFIYNFHLEVEGAAIATMISNLCALIYFVLVVMKNREETIISFSAVYLKFDKTVISDVVKQGFPGFVMTFMSFISNSVLNSLIASYSNVAVAGLGIAKKIDMMGMAIAQGMTQGVLPLIGYNYASGNHERMKSIIRLTVKYSLIISFSGAVILFLFAENVSSLFIQNIETIHYGSIFLKIICVSMPTTSITMMIITTFQAIGLSKQPTFLSMLRKGALDVPLMLIFNSAIGIFGISLATPCADIMAMIVACCIYLREMKSKLQEY